MGLIPDRWLKYSAVGAQIEGTRFIAFKVPLDKLDVNAQTLNNAEDDTDVKEMINTKIMFERIPNLGLVIDLTNTKKYYDPRNVTDLGIEYKKILVPGHVLPPTHVYREFMSTVTDFLRRNAENDKLIGVHCTHGLNRTGLMICAHMIQQCNIDPSDAVTRFETARGHKMERENYLESLRSMTASMQSLTHENPSSPALSIDGNHRTSVTQTDKGVWLDMTTKSKKKRKRNSDAIDDVRNVRGTIYVDGSNLISDGCGGYYMRVDLKDVRPIHSGTNTPRNERNYAPAPHSGQDFNGPQTYYSNHNLWRNSNHLPNTNGTFYPNQSRYSSSDRIDSRRFDHNTRTSGQSFQQQKYYNDAGNQYNQLF